MHTTLQNHTTNYKPSFTNSLEVSIQVTSITSRSFNRNDTQKIKHIPMAIKCFENNRWRYFYGSTSAPPCIWGHIMVIGLGSPILDTCATVQYRSTVTTVFQVDWNIFNVSRKVQYVTKYICLSVQCQLCCKAIFGTIKIVRLAKFPLLIQQDRNMIKFMLSSVTYITWQHWCHM